MRARRRRRIIYPGTTFRIRSKTHGLNRVFIFLLGAMARSRFSRARASKERRLEQKKLQKEKKALRKIK